jgi:MSHA biogenesis protein MshG
VIGILIKRMTLLRFSETFSIIVNSGIPINEGLNLVAQAINNMYARDEINHMQDAIQRGSSIYQAAMSCGLFTTLELQMLAISEETGELGAMMSEIARYYQREVEYDLKRLTDVMEPILLISIAIMVLLLALAVYMPIWNMVKLVHK